MIFVINAPESRAVGTVNWLEITAGDPVRRVGVQNAKLMHLEYRRSHETGSEFVALVYKLPQEPS